jgi:hypothetical protein
MADRGEGSRADRSDWKWIPSRGYGPFVFGAALADVPHVGLEVNRVDMADGEVSTTHDSTFVGISLGFWNDRLVSVGCEESFVLRDTEFIGAHFNDVRSRFTEEPIIKNYDPLIMVVFDEANLVMYLDMDWIVTSVDVSLDPELLTDQG